MVIVPTEETVDEMDDVVELANCYHASLNIERASGYGGAHRVWALRDLEPALETLGPEEVIYFGGHGLPGRFQFAFGASVDHVRRASRADPQHREPGLYTLLRSAIEAAQGRGRGLRIGAIIIQSCHSAVPSRTAGRPHPHTTAAQNWGGRDGAADSDEDFSCFPSLVRAASKALADCGLHAVLVKGYRGPAVSWAPLGRTRVVKPASSGRFGNIWAEEQVLPAADPPMARARQVAATRGDPREKGREITALLSRAIVRTIERADAERLLFDEGAGASLESSISHFLDTRPVQRR